jgi:hypothetical protein
MYNQEHIDLLNKYGVLSSALLARKYKLSIVHACSILEAIVEDHENVVHKNKHQIFIEGREYGWASDEKRRYRKRPSKWKDITKP